MKKNIGIISIHYGVNFGSSLQAVSLYQFLHNLDPELNIEIINYIPYRFRLTTRLKAACKGNPVKIAHNLVRLYRFERNNKRYKKYLMQNAQISNELHTFEQIKQRYKDFDLLISGSDQIWNSDYNQGVDPIYFLQFASEHTKRVAYAASCGKDNFSKDEWTIIRQYLTDYQMISLREQSAVKMMSDAGVKGCKFVLDPTFLLSREDWGRYETAISDFPEDYLLIYILDVEGKDIIDLANRIAKKKGLKTVLIVNGQSRKVLDSYKVDYIAHNKTPDHYIWLFRHASYIVTNSFHGVSFSINMERQFIALKRHKYNSRLDSILNAMGLLSRYAYVNDTDIKDEINYKEVNEKKELLKKESISFINESLRML